MNVVGEIGNLLATNLLHDLQQLSLEDRNCVVSTFVTKRSDSVHEGASQERELSSTSQSPSDVRAGANAAVQHDFDLVLAL